VCTCGGSVDIKASEWYRKKLVNIVNQKWHSDGSVTIRIYREGWKRGYSFKIKDYGKPEETVVEDEDIEE